MKSENLVPLTAIAIKNQVEAEYEKDIWDVRNLGLKYNLSKSNYKLNFTRICQPWLRKAVKRLIRYTLSIYSWEEAQVRLTALNRFASFLSARHSTIQPEEINRAICVQFLNYLLNKGLSSETRRKTLIKVRLFLILSARERWANITHEQMIYNEDMPKEIKQIPRYIPEEVTTQLNQYIDKLPPYLSRLVLVLQGTGRRISEICTLSFNPLLQDVHGDWFLKHFQSKMQKEDTIPLSREIVAVIQEQQNAVKEDYGENCNYLFPQPPEFCNNRGKKRWGKPILARRVNVYLNKLAQKYSIKDSSGKIWNFQSHQFRHTVGTSMINNGVPIHIVKRYLGHETFEMTMRYAHIHDQTLKEEFAKFQGKVVDVTGKVVEAVNPEIEVADLQWFKKNIQAQALPNGSCALPTIMQECPHANACLTCTHFRTTIEFIDQHKQQLDVTQKIIEKAKDNNWTRQVEMNERIANNLRNIINTLEASDGN